jgi:intracellular sulfur oxidation DsrE/DsrF family protein
MDALGTKHRMIVDTVTAAGMSDGLLFAGNFLLANRQDYSLQNQDLGVIVVARHLSTGYGFNDAMWAKYGAKLIDPAGKEAPPTNPNSRSIANLVSQGVHFAVCAMATRRLAGMIGGDTNAVFAELSANLIPNGHLAAAGIVAVSRAQERGYTFVSA